MFGALDRSIADDPPKTQEIIMKAILTAALALSVVATAGAASAQPRHDDHRGGHTVVRHDPPGWSRAHQRFHGGRYHAPKGYYAHRWGRGERLPSAWRGRDYVVDYRHYHLAPPPRGYQYVRVGNDVVLTAIATGVIASVVADLFD
jgi:Ni/Co efflux regulator RcnB